MRKLRLTAAAGLGALGVALLLGAQAALATGTNSQGTNSYTYRFKHVASGESPYRGQLEGGIYFSYLAANRAATSSFSSLLTAADRQRVERVNYRRWAVVAVVDRVPSCLWTVRIRKLVEGVTALTALRLRRSAGVCTYDNPGGAYVYDVVKFRKPTISPLTRGAAQQWLDVAPAFLGAGSDFYQLPPSSWCTDSSDPHTCVLLGSYDSIPGTPVVSVKPGESIYPMFGLGTDWTGKYTLTLVGSTQQLETLTSPDFGTRWRVPVGFSTPPEGVLGLIHAVGNVANVDYVVRFVNPPGVPTGHPQPVHVSWHPSICDLPPGPRPPWVVPTRGNPDICAAGHHGVLQPVHVSWHMAICDLPSSPRRPWIVSTRALSGPCAAPGVLSDTGGHDSP
jgi:hypothetical protein